ncbi:Carboxylate-amine ligase YbdK [Maioricimonas rarisocia]|uniref:Putative glutamate--cysteine ligase 2 n=1 Tax=Maioricimonas rarisocia TaxID=2528026 RepID=A0A517ZDQ0_9PLAN|nr:YbdK family carboxylate-amine ligase [Maioricimonas rarisocia]QDU40594.1 Carboxylate-amine ligase YbdK [Maioricimonas rarisocia]
MPALSFNRNDKPSLGVEIELQLVDSRSYALSSSIEDVLNRIPSELEANVKPELMQSYLEINTGICDTVGCVREDLLQTLTALTRVTDDLGLKLFWSATHPFSSWRRQQITVNDRYYQLVELMQDVARRLVTFGLHVHVGVESGDKAVMVCDRMLRHLPLLLALSSNSPFWEGRPTGLHSNRSKIMEGLPTAGLPVQMRNWSEYTWLVNHLVDTGFINTIREIWWDIRPHHNFGTVEIRVCDVPKNLNHVLAITAMVQSLVTAISHEIDEGTYQSEYHPMMVAQNKWRATRFGAHAQLVDSDDYSQRSVQEATDRLVDRLLPIAEQLDCVQELETCRQLPTESGAQQQLALYEETLSRRKVVERMIVDNAWQDSPEEEPSTV